MTIVESSWCEFQEALKEAIDLLGSGSEPVRVAKIIRRARTVIEMLEEELRLGNLVETGVGLPPLAELRANLEVTEKILARPAM